MDPRLVTSLLAVLSSLAQGYPQESSAELLTKSSPLEVTALEDMKTSSIEKTEEKRESAERPQAEPASSLAAKLKVRFPAEDAKPAPKEGEDDDSVRSPRQSPSRGFQHSPHTTVCIQIHSDHPEVVCGPEVEKEKDDPTSVRYAYPEHYARATPQYYPPRNAYPVHYARAAPPRYAQQPLPDTMRPSSALISTPIYSARREDESVKPVEQIVSQTPVRVISAPPPQQPLVIQRPVYQPVMSASLYPQSSQLLRLNCGVQPDSSTLLARSSSWPMMGYYPVGEQLITLQDPSSNILGLSGFDSLLPRQQSVFSSPMHARMASEGQSYILNLESPYAYSAADPWASAGYEAGFMDMQGRAAGSGFDQQYPSSMGYPSDSTMDETSRSLLQEQELQQARLRLRMLQEQLKDLHQRSSADEALKGTTATDLPKDTSTGHEQKKDQAARTSKRQARTKDT